MTRCGTQAADYFFKQKTAYEIQVLAGKGYVSLQPNYRGSTSYGDAFLRDMVGHYFQNAHLDVMTGVDEVIRRGIADPDRMVKMGWSGGGHFFFSSRRRHTRFDCDWSSDVCSSD